MGNPWIAFLLVPLVKIIVILLVVILMAAYLSYFERKILAYMQIRIGPNRVGPRGWLQPIADALKLFVKEDIVPSRAEKLVYMIAPALITAPALVVFSVIPFGADTTFFGLLKQPMPPYLTDINIGILFVLGVSSVGVYGVILGGWSSNNKFSLMGGMRSAAQLVSYDGVLGRRGAPDGGEPLDGQDRRGAEAGWCLVRLPRDRRVLHLHRVRRRRDQP
jgi:NADH-quinone oxidoreductase subunit H